MKTESRYIRFIPNGLSTFRLILAFVFPLCPKGIWGLLIISAGLSDILDGWIARRWQVQSRLGGILDGVADKLFILVALLSVTLDGAFSVWWVLPLLARDILVAFTAIYTASIRSWESFFKMEVRLPGKLATGGQFLLLFSAVLHAGAVPPMLVIAVVMSSIAAIDYGWLFILEIRRRAEANLPVNPFSGLKG